ncbi:MAG: hypothetical protein D4R79_13625 [Comamonadaceae bacterium]|nr:MAG: hypothetical protein D4R79_13625 [Comamonadaceae bacterium]
MSTTNPMTALLVLKTALGLVTGVASCKIGLESNMTPADYPMVRIVPSLSRHSAVIGSRETEVLIYFGKPIHEFESGLESLYQTLYDLEAALINAAETSGVYCQYRETIADEDRVDGYKLMALRVMVQG